MGDSELVLTFTTMLALGDGRLVKESPQPLQVKVKRRRRSGWMPTVQEQALCERVPKAVAKMCRAILRRQTQVIEGISQRKNPFSPQSQRTAHVLFDQMQAGYATQNALTKRIESDFGWNHSAAMVQSCLIWRAFRELGIGVVDEDNRMRINPSVTDNTTSLVSAT